MSAAGGRLESFLARLAAQRERECLIAGDAVIRACALEAQRLAWQERLHAHGLVPGEVVALQSDYSPQAIALFLALLANGQVAALLPRGAGAASDLLADAHAGAVWRADGADWRFERLVPAGPEPALLRSLRESGEGGFVIFSSATTGRAKAILHSGERFLTKFEGPGKGLRTLAFLLFDHIAGLDTLFYTLANGGSLVLPESRDPVAVCRLIERWRIQVLPASPTFLKLVCLTHAHAGCDLGSLEIITYGSERMGQETLDHVSRAFPNARLIQKYGTSECGSPRSRSRDRESLWIHLKQGEVETQVRDGILWLRSPATMLGYLNAPSPFDAEGWYCTGDLVEVDGEWLRILGRGAEVINVGGEKVIPQEVEDVILELPWVQEVLVRGVPHPLMGQVVEAIVHPLRPGREPDLRKRIRSHCLQRLPRHKVPVNVRESEIPLTSERHKKRRV